MVAIRSGSVIAGRYRLERMLAQGGMGSLWTGCHLQLDIPVAVKFIAPACAESEEARNRFAREAKSSARLKSPHLAQVYDYGVEEDTPYIVMELLEGEGLEKRLARRKRLPLPETARIVADACKALRRAHEAGLIHRDLKPSNIFLAIQGDEEVVKVLDFGVVKVPETKRADRLTQTGLLVGTPHYMAPEQVRSGRVVDHRADIWALGVIAFECLTGHRPFPGEEIGDVLVEICSDPIPAPSEIVPGLGPEVDRFFERALSRDPEQRHRSADELAAAISSLAGASSTPAPPEHRSAPTVKLPGGNNPPAPVETNTLSPAGATVGGARGQRRRSGLVTGMCAVALVLGASGAVLVRPWMKLLVPSAASAASPGAGAAEPEAPPAPAPPRATEPAPSSSAPSSVPVVHPPAAPAPPETARAPAAARETPALPVNHAPAPVKPALRPKKEEKPHENGQKSDDPLKEM